MNRQKGLAPILIIILIAVVVGGYLIYQNQLKPVSVSLSSPSPVASSIASSSAEIANWKTYTNTKYKFSIMYLPSMQHSFSENVNKNMQDGIKSLDTNLFSQGSMTECCGYEGPNLNILIFPEVGNERWLDDTSPSDTVSNFTIAGTTVKKLSGPAGVRIGPLKQNGFVYKFQIFSNDKTTDYKNIYKALSTFKFLDQTSLADGICAEKKTYRSLEDAAKEPNKVCYLDLSRKNLTELPKEILQFENLKDLYLNLNKLTTLPEDIKKLKNLTLIDLTGNPITIEETGRIRFLLPKVNIFNIQPMNPPQ